ncbi:MAG: hypothetical protein NWF00_09635 [Candidatus Bathyarchaeota archaeon]|nr:hypothetical protein [Candidatus Bathyarchaeota archaeon]
MTKVSVYVDDTVWASFKQKVFQKHGNLRKLSFEVEKQLQESIVDNSISSGLEKLGLKAKGTISSQEIKATRPPLRGLPSGEVLKQMRQNRVVEALSGH